MAAGWPFKGEEAELSLECREQGLGRCLFEPQGEPPLLPEEAADGCELGVAGVLQVPSCRRGHAPVLGGSLPAVS